jgi:hypothetical protein
MGEMADYYSQREWDYPEDNNVEDSKYLREKNRELYKRLTMAPQNNKKITKKFYVGSPKMNPLGNDGSLYNTWAKSSLEAAIEAAKEKCEETGEAQIVVQIVRVVRPQKQPIVVEKI